MLRACQRLKRSGEKCEEIGDLYHCLSECEVVEVSVKKLKLIVEKVLEREVTIKELICYGYNHRDKRKLKVAIWTATKVFYFN